MKASRHSTMAQAGGLTPPTSPRIRAGGRPPPGRVAWCCAFVLCVACCSGVREDPSRQAEQEAASPQTFSAEDKLVARSLSINIVSEQTATSPEQRALVCEMALASLGAKLRSTGVLLDAHQQALARASEHYRKQARAGGSDSEISERRNDLEAQYPAESERARLAISCLRELASK